KLEEKIALLRIEIEEESGGKYLAAQETYEEIKSRGRKKEALDSIKQNKQTIDEKLDDYEDFSDDMVIFLQNQLVIAILQKHPDMENSFRNLDRQLHQYSDLSVKLQTLAASSRDIEQLIDKIA